MKNKYIMLAFSVLALAVMAIPGIVSVCTFEKDIYSNYLQGDSISAHTSAFDQYFKDKFFGRSFFYRTNSYIKRSYLNISSKPQKVITGKDGWLFLGNSFENVLHESLGYRYFTKDQIAKVQIKLINYKEWLNERGIKFYCSIAPNKHTIYPEYLPYTQSGLPRQLEQLKMQLEVENNFTLIDLRGHLLPEKGKQRLFKKTDTHWNDFGAFYASKLLLENIQADFPEVPVWGLDDFSQDSIVSFHQDLSDMLRLPIKESNIKLSFIDTCAQKVEKQLIAFRPKQSERGYYEKRFKCKKRNLKLVMLRDSFGSAMLPFLANAFGESLFIWDTAFDKELIEREQPDVVVLEIIERHLEHWAR